MGRKKDSAKARDQLHKRYAEAQNLLAELKFEGIQHHLKGFNEALLELAEVRQFGSSPVSPRFSVVLVSNAHSPAVEEMLQSIAADDEFSVEREIIVVDNGNSELLDATNKVFPSFVFVRSPFPVGASGGRNLGAAVAKGGYVVFIDDDGSVCAGCTGSLIRAIEETDAVCVRGRVVPKTAGIMAPPHYDLGNVRMPALASCEGISAWRREDFLRNGGFDVVLFGHEGVELCARMFKFHGPLSFVYEPAAVLQHDPSAGTKAAEKAKRYELNKKYIQFQTPHTYEIVSEFNAYKNRPKDFYLGRAGLHPTSRSAANEPLSILTTARNAAPFLDDYASSWKRILPENCEIIYVDDNSEDGSFAAMQERWVGDHRFIAVSNSASGRGAALNTAVSTAKNDICLIADVDDISTKERILNTRQTFEDHPELDYLSFLLFNEKDIFRSPRKTAPLIAHVGIEALFGMPAPYPAFAFRRSRFSIPFDENLTGGIDCDWFRKHLALGGLRGLLVQKPVTYYRQHGGQITKNHNSVQKTIRKQLIYQEFSRICGDLTEEDLRCIDILVDIREASDSDKSKVLQFIIRTVDANRTVKIHDVDVLALTLLEVFKSVRSAVSARSKVVSDGDRFEQLRASARQHIELREFKKARRTLRQALQIRKDVEIQRLLLVASKYGFIRAIANKLW